MPRLTSNEFERRLRKARTTGLGAAGMPRMGRPKTEAERGTTHFGLHGTTELPARGYGLLRKKRRKRILRPEFEIEKRSI